MTSSSVITLTNPNTNYFVQVPEHINPLLISCFNTAENTMKTSKDISFSQQASDRLLTQESIGKTIILYYYYIIYYIISTTARCSVRNFSYNMI